MFARFARPRMAVAIGTSAAAGTIGYCGSSAHCQRLQPTGLDPTVWTPLTLSKITPLTSSTAVYRFAYEDPKASSGMTTASCLVAKAEIGEEQPDGSRANVIRAYTPITRPEQAGYLELAVKTYPNGKMSQHMKSLKLGDKLDFQGPFLKTAYKANQFSHVGMVAGGTGIAPMLQLLDEILENPADKTKVSLVFANVSADDILFKSLIDAREARYPGRLSVYYVVSKSPVPSVNTPQWKGGVGYFTTTMLASQLPPPSDQSMVYVCGPPAMYKAVCGEKPPRPGDQGEFGGILKELGYSSSNVFKF